ncbi:plasmodesmata callose-binding protein 5 [Striga asiatica]|uniref:Plasmodesmata callose-binding protein 5 n=1 Tax=Striga asiatica TaxID=4170 RepID=A0A5A7QGH9_STRAF|nr:plasmodesmata callose-binding protein 5 [Striga asiatica]
MAIGSSSRLSCIPPTDNDIKSTPSLIASSIDFRIADAKHIPSSSHMLYTAILALGEPPFAVPSARPQKEAPATGTPAAIEEMLLKKFQERVVCNFNGRSGKTDTTPSRAEIDFASSSDKRAENPKKLLLYV